MRTLKRAVHNMNALDLSVFIFLVYFNIRLSLAPESPEAEFARSAFQSGLTLWVVSILLSRGELLRHPRARGLTHRFALLLSILGLYLVTMRQALAALKPTLLDAQLITLDRALLGEVPALLLDPYTSPLLTEWFAFFYYSYFVILVGATFPSAFFGRSALARALVLGPIMIVCVGHILYTLVPGRGPYVMLEFEHALVGGFFWDQVNRLVTSQGALLDIFPSLHTALPLHITLILAYYRREWSWRLPWAALWFPLAFFTFNIIIATLYLRWHYAVDVIAGVALALMTQWVVVRFNPSDEERESSHRQPIFEPCLDGLMRSRDRER